MTVQRAGTSAGALPVLSATHHTQRTSIARNGVSCQSWVLGCMAFATRGTLLQDLRTARPGKLEIHGRGTLV